MSKLINMLEGRQHTEVVFARINRAQLAASLVANGGPGYVEFEAPQGSVLLRGFVRVLSVFDGTTPTLDVGDAADDDRYTSTPINLGSAAVTNFTADGYVYGANGNTNKLRLTYAVAGDPTEVGELLLMLEFVKEGKAYYTQGNASAPHIPANPGPHA